MQVSTTFTIEGYNITEYKGLVRGIVVRSPTIGGKSAARVLERRSRRSSYFRVGSSRSP
jgi:uncharacterized protein YbjQ (UPF0145 family)